MNVEMTFRVSGSAGEARAFLSAMLTSLDAVGVVPAINVTHPYATTEEAAMSAEVAAICGENERAEHAAGVAAALADGGEPKKKRGRPSNAEKAAQLSPVVEATVMPEPAEPAVEPTQEEPAPTVAPPADPVPPAITVEHATELWTGFTRRKGPFKGKTRVAFVMNLIREHGATSTTALPPENLARFVDALKAAIAEDDAAQSAAPKPATPNSLFD